MEEVSQNNQTTLERAARGGLFTKLKIFMISFLANNFPMSMATRAKFYKRLGVKVGKDCLLGQIIVDGIHPEDIIIGDGCTITKGVVMLTHFYDTNNLTEHAYTRGRIKIGNRCYIGMNTIFSKPISVGDGAVIGAGSVVTKNIPPFEIWAGVPARFIKKRYSDLNEIPSMDSFKPR